MGTIRQKICASSARSLREYLCLPNTGTGETIYMPFSKIQVSLENKFVDATLEIPKVAVEFSETNLEATLQDNIFQATLYDDREVDFEHNT